MFIKPRSGCHLTCQWRISYQTCGGSINLAFSSVKLVGLHVERLLQHSGIPARKHVSVVGYVAEPLHRIVSALIGVKHS